jgi:hypothetical protein
MCVLISKLGHRTHAQHRAKRHACFFFFFLRRWRRDYIYIYCFALVSEYMDVLNGYFKTLIS